MKRFETINPCLNCETKECGLVDGQECQRCIDYLSLKKDFETIKKEYDFTREYIHDNGLEWDLLSKWSARKEWYNVHSNRSSKQIFSKQTDRFEMDKQWQNQSGQGCQGLPNTER